jgi:hypothetical protein
MSKASAAQPGAPPETQDPNPPDESAAAAPDNILEPTPNPTRAPPEILEWGDDSFYAQHWGINE